MLLIPSWQRGEHSTLMPQKLCLLHEKSRGLYKVRACSQALVIRNKGIWISSFCIVSKTLIGWRQ